MTNEKWTTILYKKLAEVTKKGHKQTWVERIGLISDEIGLEPNNICWQGSPVTVAFNVVEMAERHDKLNILEETIKKYAT